MRRSLVGLAMVLALGTAAPPASADAYDAAMTDGVSARDKALETNSIAAWRDALDAFTRADALRSTKDSKYEMANAAVRLHADDLAVDSYEAALDLGLAGPAAKKAKAFVAANAGKMARVVVVAPDGTVVRVDDHERGTTPLQRPIVVFSGKVHLSARSKSGRSTEQVVETKANATSTVDLTEDLRDGNAASATTALPSAAPPPPSSTAPLEASADAPPVADGAGHTGSLVLAITGGAVLASGVVTVLVANSKLSAARDSIHDGCLELVPGDSDQCKTPKPTYTTAQSDNDAIATWRGVRIAGVVGIGLGAVVAAVGVVSLLSGSSSSSSTSGAAWTPTFDVGTRGGTLGVKAVF